MKPLRYNIRLNSRQWLTVVVWETHEEYLRGTAHHYQLKNKHPRRTASYLRLNKTGGAFGRMYFSSEHISACTVAHEVFHFVSAWMRAKYKIVGPEQDEILAGLADKMTNAFWKRYFRRWPEKT